MEMCHESLDEFYSYVVFKNFSIIGGCSVNLNIQTPNRGALPPKMTIFVENDSNKFDYISEVCARHLPK
jgi:hypothetical protein